MGKHIHCRKERAKPDDSDWTEALRTCGEAVATSRGYADEHAWEPDRERAERDVARILRAYRIEMGEQLSGTFESLQSDPPDVVLTTDNGKRVGIEVTELVDGKIVAWHRHQRSLGNLNDFVTASWTPNSVAAEIYQRVAKKDAKLAQAEGTFGALLLVITTNEPMIDEQCAREAVALCRPAVKYIGRAFLMLGYHPETDSEAYPDRRLVLPIPLSR